MALLIFVFLFILVFMGFPVAFAIGITSLITLIQRGFPSIVLVQRMVNGLDAYTLLAVPLFILAGNVMNKLGVTDKIFAFATSLVGHKKGSMAHVNVISSMMFAGISGVAQADAAGLGAVEMKAMENAGYEKPFSAAITAVSSIIGPIIPPSVIMAVFSVSAGISLGKLFLAGLIPGLIMGASLMIMISFMVATGRVKGNVYPKAPLKEVIKCFWGALPALFTPILLIGGMLAGVATPTELGALCVIYASLVGIYYKTFNMKLIISVLEETLVMVGSLVLVIAMAFPFSWVIATYNIPSMLSNLVLPFINTPWLILLMMNVILLFLGMFMETTAILLIMVPVLFPVMNSLGMDPVHFGIVMIINLLIGAVTPPFGMCLYIVADIGKISFVKVVKATVPFFIPLLFTLLLCTFVPQVVLWFPNLVSGS